MGNLTLNGSTSGAITVSPPAVAGTNTITLPAATGTVALTASPTFTGNVTVGANLIFSGTPALITGDFNNNISFQTSTANSATSVSAIPNGTNNVAAYTAFNSPSINNSSYAQFYVSSAATTIDSGKLGTGTYLPMTFSVNAQERMRIDTNGNLLVGTTSYSSVSDGNQISPSSGIQITSNAGFNVQLNKSASPSQTAFQTFNINNALVAYINYNGSGVSFTGLSDYRLKDEIQPLSGSLAKVLAIKPVSYVWKPTGIVDEGFLAHELQSIIPRAVDGEKDAVNEDGSIKPQGVDPSKIIVHLVAAIQELEARLAALEAK